MPTRYYVSMVDEMPIPIYGPYSLRAAKDFARIGSQYGGRRAVTRGRQGPLVRIYAQGRRDDWTANPVGVWVRPASESPGVFEAFHLTDPIGYVFYDRGSRSWAARSDTVAQAGFPVFDAALTALQLGSTEATRSMRPARKGPPS